MQLLRALGVGWARETGRPSRESGSAGRQSFPGGQTLERQEAHHRVVAHSPVGLVWPTVRPV